MSAHPFMKYLPFENITYRSSLSEEEILERLEEVLEPPQKGILKGIWENKHKPYRGTISGHSFSIEKVIDYRNTFLPRIKGTFSKRFNSTMITVKMRMHPLALVFIKLLAGRGQHCFIDLPCSRSKRRLSFSLKS